MDAGKLNKRITIQRPEMEKRPSGQLVKTGKWIDVCTVWAEIKCKNTNAVTSDGIVVYEGLYHMYIRWRTGINADMRVKWKNRIFELVSPPSDWTPEREGLTLITRERV